MGINAYSAEFLLQAQSSGVSFRKTITLGRQNLLADPAILKSLFQQYGISGFENALAENNSLPCSNTPFCDPFFRALGTDTLDSLDADAYQESSHVHDLNQPIPLEWHRQYDCVVDGGTLEHIFSFPTAIQSCMEMVKPGGHLILITPANNFFGHGFYQFSPELFFRILSSENGFCVERMIAIESENLIYQKKGSLVYYEEKGRAYQVLDPALTGKRGALRNNKSVLLHIQAKRQADVPLFTTSPQQSDYVTLWEESGQKKPLQSAVKPVKALIQSLKPFIPPFFLMRYQWRLASFKNRESFR